MKKLGAAAACLALLAVSVWGANPIQVKYETGTGSGYFGGDYQTDSTSRNIGNGVAITLEENIMVDQFAFNFRGGFDNDETSAASEVTLLYAIRKADGSILKMEEVTMSDTFSGGWIHWENINVPIEAPGPVIFTCHVQHGHYNYITSSVNGDTDAGDSSAVRYVCTKTSAPHDMIAWSGYNAHSWDTYYWLQGKPLMGKVPPQPVYMRLDVSALGGGYFGGDYRAGMTARNVGTGVAVTIDTHMVLQNFSFEFDSFSGDSSKAPEEATLVFTVRDTDGSPLKSGEVVVDTSFDGGWVTWSNINQPVNAPGPVIVTCYVKDGHTNYIKSINRATDAFDDASVRYTCTQSEDPFDMDTWDNWNEHSWDVHYILEGQASVEGFTDFLPGAGASVPALTVSPNPFVQTVTISLKDAGTVDYVTIQDLQGREIRRLEGGAEQIVWDGTDANGMRVQPGAYVGIVVSGGVSVRTGIILSN